MIVQRGSDRRFAVGLALVGWALAQFGLGQPAAAENDRGSASGFFNQERARAMQPGPVAVPDSRRPAGPSPRAFRLEPPRSFDVRARAAAPAVAAVKPPSPNPHKIGVAVYGDRFAQALASGLQDGDDDTVTVLRSTSDDAGLTRPDFTAWVQSIHDALAAPTRPGVAVMVVGSNDRAALGDAAARTEPETPAWEALYGSRVETLSKLFRDARIPLIWVGLPPVRNPETSAEYVRLNGIVRDHATRDGAVFVDSWEAFTDDAGRYSADGPNVDGQTVRLRRADGVGFTRAGALKLASFVDADLNRLARRPSTPAKSDLADLRIERPRDFDAALDIDVNAQIRREAARDGTAGPAEPHEHAAEAPAAGPVVSLTTPPSASNGTLVSLPTAVSEPRQQASLGDGSPAPKPGRTDDFSWPRP